MAANGSPHVSTQTFDQYTTKTGERAETPPTKGKLPISDTERHGFASAASRAAGSALMFASDTLPYAWRYTLASDVLYWGVLGTIAFFFPDSALHWNYKMAKRYGWTALPVTTMHFPGVKTDLLTSPVSETLRM